MTDPTFYDTLHVPEDASKADIRKNYKKLANKFHPDKESGDTDRFQQIKLAYETLYDDDARQYYDKTGKAKEGQNTHQRALGELEGMFLSALMTNIEQLDRVNVVQQVKDKIRGSKREVDAAILKLSSNIGKLDKAKDRIVSEHDMLGNIITSEIEKFEGLIVQNKKNIELLDTMAQLIEDYDYRIDEPRESYLSTFSSGTATGSGTWL